MGPGGLEVCGVVEGDITIEGTLTLHEGASISGEVRAGRIVVEGAFEGLALATEWLRVGRAAAFKGLGVAPEITVHQEAHVEGEFREQTEEPLAGVGELRADFSPEPSLDVEAKAKPRRIRRRRRRRSTAAAPESKVAQAGTLGKMPRLTGLKVRRAREDYSND